jgi:predicted Zn-dependent peptidase
VAKLLRVAGLQLLHQRQPGGRVLLQLWLRAGSASEPSAALGVAAAAQRASLRAARRTIKGLDGRSRGWTTVDHTIFELEVPASKLSRALEALRQLRDGALASADLAAARSEGAQRAEQPAAAGYRQLLALALGADHPYARVAPAATPPEPQAIREHRRARYGGGTLVALGDVAEDELISALRGVFPRVPRSPPSTTRDSSTLAGPRLRAAERKSASEIAELQLAFVDPRPVARRGDGAALELLARVLDERVLPQLRARPGLSIGNTRAFAFAGRQAGLLVIRCRVAAAQQAVVLRRLLDAAFALRALPTTEIVRARRAWRVQRALLGETPSGRARLLAGRVEHGLGTVKAAALRSLARRLLLPSRLSLLVAGARPLSKASLRRTVDAADAQLNSALARPIGEHLRFASGARLAIERRAHDSLIALKLRWSGGGRALETARSAGAARLIAGQLTRCSGKALAWRVEALGGDLELTAVGLPGSGAELLSQIASCARRLPLVGLRRLRLELLGQVLASPRGRLDRLFLSMLHTDGRGQPWQGTVTGLSLSGERLRAHARRALSPQRLRIAVAGAVERDALIASSYRLFGRPPRGGVRARPSSTLAASPVEEVAPSLPASLASVGAVFARLNAEQRVALRCIADWLRTEPLTVGAKKLPLEVRLELSFDSGHLQATLKSPEAIDAGVAQLRRQLLAVGQRGLSATWISSWRKGQLAAAARRGQRVLPRAAALLRALVGGQTSAAELGALRRLDVEATRRVAVKLLGARQLVVAILRRDPGASPAAQRDKSARR